jgi:hypothetical protein
VSRAKDINVSYCRTVEVETHAWFAQEVPRRPLPSLQAIERMVHATPAYWTLAVDVNRGCFVQLYRGCAEFNQFGTLIRQPHAWRRVLLGVGRPPQIWAVREANLTLGATTKSRNEILCHGGPRDDSAYDIDEVADLIAPFLPFEIEGGRLIVTPAR